METTPGFFYMFGKTLEEQNLVYCVGKIQLLVIVMRCRLKPVQIRYAEDTQALLHKREAVCLFALRQGYLRKHKDTQTPFHCAKALCLQPMQQCFIYFRPEDTQTLPHIREAVCVQPV